jgi:hypothetical protein
MCGALSDEDGSVIYSYICIWALPEQYLLGSEPHRTHNHILLSLLRLPQPGGPGPRIYIPQEQCDWALGSLLLASYSLQGCSGDSLTHLHSRGQSHVTTDGQSASTYKENCDWLGQS